MKIPRTIKRYCSKCRIHTDHKIIREKARQKGSLGRIERHRSERINRGYGSTPYKLPQNSKRHNAKRNKRIDLRLECNTCKRKTISQTDRIKRFELI